MKSKNYYISSIISILSALSFSVFATLLYHSMLLLIPYENGSFYLMLSLFSIIIFAVSSIFTVIQNHKRNISVKNFFDKKSKTGCIISFSVLVIMFACFIALSQYFYCFGEVDGEQLFYHMLVSASGMDASSVFAIGIPAVVGGIMFGAMLAYIYYAIICMMRVNDKIDMSRKKNWLKKGSVVTSIVAVCLTVAYLFNVIPFLDFISYQMSEPSSFISDNYADPKTTNITFPDEKRNLILIYMESMENTFAGAENGGGFGINMMPEIVNLQNENISFSNTDKLGGAVETYGMTYTTAGIVATTFGLPLKVGSNATLTNADALLPNAYNLFDVLNDAGYNQYISMGSEANFGGLIQLFDSHGDTVVYDYTYLVETGYIPKNYKVFWGVEDAKLYEFSKEKITEASREEKPFAFIMDTIDTHSPDGWVCEKCRSDFNLQYCNVIACASRQLQEFIDWAKTQEWYDNTTIVVVGDHLSMKNNFFVSLDDDYERTTINLIINPAPSVTYDVGVLKNRDFCSMDIFPTILCAMGCEIEGDRLGLGTNLFSGKKTLFEELGYEYVNDVFRQKSTFYENVFRK